MYRYTVLSILIFLIIIMQHLVLFKFDPIKLRNDFGELKNLQKCFDELKSYIPGVGYIEIKEVDPEPWPGYQDASGGWSHVLLSTHTSADDLKVYAEHPQHKALQARMAACMLAVPLRIEMDDPKQANPNTMAKSSGNGLGIQHLVLFMFDGARLRDEFDSLEDLQNRFAELQRNIPGCGYIEFKPKNPEPWPRYADASLGYTHVLLSTHSSADDLRRYAEDKNHQKLQGRMKKCMVAPPLRIEMNYPSYSNL